MTVTFQNVTITMEADSPWEAYVQLCELLEDYLRSQGGTIEWHTDTYSIDGGEPRETTELWPT